MVYRDDCFPWYEVALFGWLGHKVHGHVSFKVRNNLVSWNSMELGCLIGLVLWLIVVMVFRCTLVAMVAWLGHKGHVPCCELLLLNTQPKRLKHQTPNHIYQITKASLPAILNIKSQAFDKAVLARFIMRIFTLCKSVMAKLVMYLTPPRYFCNWSNALLSIAAFFWKSIEFLVYCYFLSPARMRVHYNLVSWDSM